MMAIDGIPSLLLILETLLTCQASQITIKDLKLHPDSIAIINLMVQEMIVAWVLILSIHLKIILEAKFIFSLIMRKQRGLKEVT